MPGPYALVLRKQLVQALEEKLMPAFRGPQVPLMLLAEMPMRLPTAVKVKHLAVPLLEDEGDNSPNPFVRTWEAVGLNSLVCPNLVFILEGEADFRVGTTRAMAHNLSGNDRDSPWAQYGCHVLQIAAPALLLLPAGVPYSDGSRPHWERPHPERAHSRILWCHVWQRAVQCHLCQTRSGQHSGGEPVVVNDASLVEMTGLVHQVQQELRGGELNCAAVAQSLLMALLLRLHRRLIVDDPNVTNYSSFFAFERRAGQPAAAAGPPPAILSKVNEFVLTHLHEPIQVGQVARYCDVSPTHLSRIFRTTLGTTVKGYIDRQKMASARQMLTEDKMAVKEVARQLGFTEVAHFSRTFSRHSLMSPSHYRKRAREKDASAVSGNSIDDRDNASGDVGNW